jgi:Ca2+-binding EF-hand superfamily protein
MTNDPWVHQFAQFCGIVQPHFDLDTLSTFLWTFEMAKPQLFQVPKDESKKLTLTPQQDKDPLVSVDLPVLAVGTAVNLLQAVTKSAFLHTGATASPRKNSTHEEAAAGEATHPTILKLARHEFKASLPRRIKNTMYLSVDAFMQTFLELWVVEQEAMRAHLMGLFNTYDEDGNGSLDFDEFRGFIRKVMGDGSSAGTGDAGLTEHEVRRMYIQATADSGEDGAITSDNFITLAQTRLKKYMLREGIDNVDVQELKGKAGQLAMRLSTWVRELFDKYDVSGDGLLEVDELGNLLRDLNLMPPKALKAGEGKSSRRPKSGKKGGKRNQADADPTKETAADLEQINGVLEAVDIDGSGEVDYQEVRVC